MSYYWYNIQELQQKAKGKYHNCEGKEKAAKYYQINKDVIKEESCRRRERGKKRILQE